MADVTQHHQRQLELDLLLPTLTLLAEAFCKYHSDANRLLADTKVKAASTLALVTDDTQLKPWLFAIMHETFRRDRALNSAAIMRE